MTDEYQVKPTPEEENKPVYRVIGTQPIRHDGMDKVTGRALYGADIRLPGMLYGAVLRSPHAHARILAIDTSQAEALPGVKAVVTSADLPEVEDKMRDQGEGSVNLRYQSNNTLARDKALYYGHAVAAVAATSLHVAQEAASLIRVTYLRCNMPVGDVAYNGLASASAPEPQGAGAGCLAYTLNNPAVYLVEGQNVLAVHAFNQSLSSSDFGFNAQLYVYVANPSTIPPFVSAVVPAAGTVFALSHITVAFSEPVTGVDAADLLVNGVPATSLSSTTDTTYAFGFTQPPFGPVSITWAIGHGITDFDDPPKAFARAGPGATFSYSLLNPDAPTVASQTPLAGATVNSLTQVTVACSRTRSPTAR